jgi:hypothetical protein
VASTEYERRKFYADVLTGAVEGGVNYWAAVEGYRWFDPELEGGSAEPGPDGSPNAYAVIVPNGVEESDGDFWPQADGASRARVTVESVRRAIGQIVRGDVPGWPKDTGTARRIARAQREWDSGDLDGSDCEQIVQVAIFGKGIFG